MTDQRIRGFKELKDADRGVGSKQLRTLLRTQQFGRSGARYAHGYIGSKFGAAAPSGGSMYGGGSSLFSSPHRGGIGGRRLPNLPATMHVGQDALIVVCSERGDVVAAMKAKMMSFEAAGVFALKASPAPERPTDSVPARDAILYEAAESVRQASFRRPSASAVGQAASLLHRAAQREADARPRHAAIALAAWDAIQCTERPFETEGRRKVFFEVARTLLAQFISTEDEIHLLDRMDAVGLERVPPFEETFAGSVFEPVDGDSLR